jgi:hypothetical protein
MDCSYFRPIGPRSDSLFSELAAFPTRLTGAKWNQA